MITCGGWCLPGECDCHACAVCGEATLNDKLCRDCDIEKLMSEVSRCPCGYALWGSLAIKLGTPQAHEDTCPHAETGAYGYVPDDEPKPEPLQAAWESGYRAGRASLKESDSRE